MRAVHWLGDDELLAGRYERYANAAGLRYLPRPRTGGINDDWSFNCAFRSRQAGDFATPDVHGECVGLRQQGRAPGRRCSGIADGNLRWVEIPVITDPHRHYDTRRLQERVEAAGPLRRDEFDIKAVATPAFEIRLDNFRVLWPTRDFQAARMHPVKGLASLFRECFDLAASVLDEANHQVAFSSAAYHAGGAG